MAGQECPDFSDFKKGYFYQDTEDFSNANAWPESTAMIGELSWLRIIKGWVFYGLENAMIGDCLGYRILMAVFFSHIGNCMIDRILMAVFCSDTENAMTGDCLSYRILMAVFCSGIGNCMIDRILMAVFFL